MSHIVFRMYPQQSHFNETFYLARLLKQRGHTITYATIFKMKESVEGNGFQFYNVPEEEDLLPPPIQREIRKRGLGLSSLYKRLRFFSDYKERIKSRDFFSRVVGDLKPDLLILDGAYKFFSFQLFPHSIPFIFAETTVSTRKGKSRPPLNYSICPRNSIFFNLLTELMWLLYHDPIKAILKREFKRLCEDVGYPKDKIEFDRYFRPGFKSIPEINLTPRAFDFPFSLEKNCFHVCQVYPEERFEVEYDWAFNEFFSKIKNADYQVIYCSFGTMAWRYPNYDTLLLNILEIFRTDQKIILILCVEDDRLRRRLRKLGIANAHIFRKVPQTVLLTKVNLMISHGGINSIHECILNNVPMLICPGGRYLDQFGNAGRVKFHGIGLETSFVETKYILEKKVRSLLHDSTYLARIEALRLKIQNDDRSLEGIQFIESFIHDASSRNDWWRHY